MPSSGKRTAIREGIIHRPPTVNDLKEALVAARNGYDTTLFVLTSKGVWILVSKHREFEGLDFESNEVIHEFNQRFQEYSKYRDSIQGKEFDLVDAHNYGRYFSLEYLALMG